MNKRQKKKAWKNRMYLGLWKGSKRRQYVLQRLGRVPLVFLSQEMAPENLIEIAEMFRKQIQGYVRSYRIPIVSRNCNPIVTPPENQL